MTQKRKAIINDSDDDAYDSQDGPQEPEPEEATKRVKKDSARMRAMSTYIWLTVRCLTWLIVTQRSKTPRVLRSASRNSKSSSNCRRRRRRRQKVCIVVSFLSFSFPDSLLALPLLAANLQDYLAEHTPPESEEEEEGPVSTFAAAVRHRPCV